VVREALVASEVFRRLRARLDEFEAGGAGGVLSPDAEQSLLSRRATRLAQEHRSHTVQPGLQLALFSRKGARYGLPLEEILSIETVSSVTPVPGTETAVAGVVHRLGRIHAVFDLALLFGGESEQKKKNASDGDPARWIVFASSGTVAVGLLADDLSDITYRAPGETGALLGGLPARLLPAVRGITSDLITILDPAGLVTEELSGGGGGR
jgi:chemotaxis signal transduction protein